MREVLAEIWVENKWHPIVVLVKLVLIFVMLFGSALSEGFPYRISFYYLVFSFNIMLLSVPQIDFFLPRSREEWYRMKWKKCLLVSIFYAGVAAGGYILNVAFMERYHFDFIHISTIWITFSLLFAIMLENRLELEYTRYQEALEDLEEKEKNNLPTSVLLAGISAAVAFLLIILLCIVDFAEVDALLFLRQKKFRIVEFLLYIGLMGHWLYMVKCSQEKLKSFYMDD